jgi:uncharacterized protein (TIGR02588 family)
MGSPGAATRPRKQDRPRAGEASSVPLAEWVAAAFGAVVMLATLACLLWLAFTERDGRVDPLVHVVSIERQGERHHVKLRVDNRGGAAAAGLRVQAQLRRGEAVVEEAEVEFDHVPAHAHRTAGLFFRNDPRQAALELSVSSYRQP